MAGFHTGKTVTIPVETAKYFLEVEKLMHQLLNVLVSPTADRLINSYAMHHEMMHNAVDKANGRTV